MPKKGIARLRFVYTESGRMFDRAGFLCGDRIGMRRKKLARGALITKPYLVKVLITENMGLAFRKGIITSILKVI